MNVRDIILTIQKIIEDYALNITDITAIYTDYATQKLLSALNKLMLDKEDKEIEQADIPILKKYLAIIGP